VVITDVHHHDALSVGEPRQIRATPCSGVVKGDDEQVVVAVLVGLVRDVREVDPTATSPITSGADVAHPVSWSIHAW
jgi:hypothetical protein